MTAATYALSQVRFSRPKTFRVLLDTGRGCISRDAPGNMSKTPRILSKQSPCPHQRATCRWVLAPAPGRPGVPGVGRVVQVPQPLPATPSALSQEAKGERAPCQRDQLWADARGRLFHEVRLPSDQPEGAPRGRGRGRRCLKSLLSCRDHGKEERPKEGVLGFCCPSPVRRAFRNKRGIRGASCLNTSCVQGPFVLLVKPWISPRFHSQARQEQENGEGQTGGWRWRIQGLWGHCPLSLCPDSPGSWAAPAEKAPQWQGCPGKEAAALARWLGCWVIPQVWRLRFPPCSLGPNTPAGTQPRGEPTAQLPTQTRWEPRETPAQQSPPWSFAGALGANQLVLRKQPESRGRPGAWWPDRVPVSPLSPCSHRAVDEGILRLGAARSQLGGKGGPAPRKQLRCESGACVFRVDKTLSSKDPWRLHPPGGGHLLLRRQPTLS